MNNPTDRLLLRIPDATDRLGLSRSTLYELIAAGELPVVRIGRAVRVPAAALVAWVEHRIPGSAREPSPAP